MGVFLDYDKKLISDNPFDGQSLEQPLGEILKDRFSFSYEECKDLYSYWSLGKRIVESIIDFSLSVDREVSIKNAPEEVGERFKEVEKQLRITEVVKNVLVIARTYGTAGLFLSSRKPNDDFKNLSIEDYRYDFKFNVLDPLNFKVTISQDPRSFDFLTPINMAIYGSVIGKNRGLVIFNGNPLYIQYNKSSLNYGGRSVFCNMGRLITTWNTLFNALEGIAVKAGATIIQNDQTSMTDATSYESAIKSAQLFKEMATGKVAMLNAGQTASFFNLSGANEIALMIKEVKEALAMALNDTPSAVLLDKDLSNGLSNGSEDMRNVIIKVNTFRQLYLKPVYGFIDKHLFFKAWDDDFINSIKTKNENYAGLSNIQIRQQWIQDFSFQWNSIYPKTPDEATKSKAESVDMLVKIQNMGAEIKDIEEALNGLQLFKESFVLNEVTPHTFVEEEV